MTTLAKKETPSAVAIDQHVDRCLAMIIHHPVVEEMAKIIKKIRRTRNMDGLVGDGK